MERKEPTRRAMGNEASPTAKFDNLFTAEIVNEIRNPLKAFDEIIQQPVCAEKGPLMQYFLLRDSKITRTRRSAHEEDAQWLAGQMTSRRPTALHRHNALCGLQTGLVQMTSQPDAREPYRLYVMDYLNDDELEGLLLGNDSSDGDSEDDTPVFDDFGDGDAANDEELQLPAYLAAETDALK
ncbi:hypothetical protein J6590_065582 [Homalodisca vitripennis]|nr:hypothetical protein J6590_065582 [Homalodisca vitripennis]